MAWLIHGARNSVMRPAAGKANPRTQCGNRVCAQRPHVGAAVCGLITPVGGGRVRNHGVTRTLIVEDDGATRQILAQVVRERGHESVAVESAEHGMARCLTGRFDIALVDTTLPGMDGLRFCRWLTRLPQAQGMVIMACTAKDRPQDIHAMLDAGAHDYVIKPLDTRWLNTRLTIAERMVNIERERRDATEALQWSEQNFRMLVECLPDGVAVVHGRELIYANERMTQMVGVEALENRQWSVADVASPEHREALSDAVAACAAGKESAEAIEFRLAQPDAGECVQVEGRFIPVAMGGARCVLVLLRDISLRAQLESHVRRTERLVSLGTLAAGLAHEVNNPLTAVMGNMTFLAQALAEHARISPRNEDMPLWQDTLSETLEASHRIAQVVSDLREFSRPTSEETGPVKALEAVRSAARLTRNLLEHRGTLRVDVPADLTVEADQTGLVQVLVNLLANAAHSLSPGNGPSSNRVTVTARRVPESGEVAFCVSDSGDGIAEEHLPFVFDPFFTTRAPGAGMGMGLSICHTLVRGWGGTIRAESPEGHGTMVTMMLPEYHQESDAHDGEGNLMRVLLVDDDAAVCRALSRMLQRQCRVTVAGSAQEALSLLDGGERFDAILCDIMMPETSGLDLVRTLETTHPLMAPKVVLMTGASMKDTVARFRQQLQSQLLFKPLSPQTVMDALSLVTEGVGSRGAA